MSAAVTQPPIVPPRPSRSQDRDQMPKIPPRPVNRRLEQSSSPSRGRFAPSPLNDNPLASAKSPPQIFGLNSSEPIDRSSSVDLPSLGEEGREYAAFAGENNSSADGEGSSPEQTANVDQNLKLHAPKPSLPALSAKQRVAAVTRTDSDKAASFGIGKPSSEDPVPSNRSLKKKASTTSQLSANTESHMDDEHGIPEIGQQVPMYPHAGDVQAPSPAPGSEGLKPKHHNRKTSARGFTSELPPGSYGLHGHGVKSQDKLEKAYYEKHPELVHKESNKHHHDRPNDYSMSREELNKIVRATAERGTSNGFGTPTEQCGWEAIEESASRITSPRPASTAPNSPELKRRSLIEGAVSESGKSDDQVIHVGDPKRRSVMFDDKSPEPLEGEDGYTAPILAEDEVANNASDLQPAVSPPAERSGSAFEMEPSSRPTSRPASIYRDSSMDVRSTPLEDVQEYEPLFPEDDKAPVKEPEPAKKEDKKQRFPSRDIWEDAPDSVHEGAEVSTPDIPQEGDGVFPPRDVPTRDDTETPAHAFARRQEQLAEDESKQSPDAFLHRNQKPSWVQSQSHIVKEVANEKRPSAKRFPSRDVWEDTPESLQLETTVSQEQDEAENASPVEAKAPEIPQRPVRKITDPSSATTEKPMVPERPKSKQPPNDDATAAKPTVPERPKPQVPARPTKQGSGSSKDGEAAASPDTQAKSVIPSRPGGSKIAALQAGFMADLNKRLQLGPQIPKVEEPAAQEEPSVEQEKAPLVDARKGRARGPQRRAPAKSPAPAVVAAAAAPSEKPVLSLSFSSPVTLFSIDPHQGHVSIGGTEKSLAVEKPPMASEAVEDDKPSAEPVAPPAKEAEKTETTESTQEAKPETLATNMAGEPVVEVDVEEKKAVEPTAAE